jgi:DNA-binding transcriptional regulator LsrR (DeoR family)
MILVHLDTNDSILLLCNDKSFHALYYIIKQMDLNTNIWYADKINKTTIANKLEISLASLEKMIASLKRNNLIRPTSRGIYQLTELLKDY